MTIDLLDPKAARQALLDAGATIRSRVHRTPLLKSRALSEMAGQTLRLKCENLQRAGFAVDVIRREVLRNEGDDAVGGLVVTARKPS